MPEIIPNSREQGVGGVGEVGEAGEVGEVAEVGEVGEVGGELFFVLPDLLTR
ncbi:hypothetical protein VB638_10795 [Dolichospermum sp. UHCC 0684]|uniref:hypothetical protein n=1 Tax=Dolichospermum sp. UHCC 0260 TaxID=2590025 RepID=UPI001C2C8D43|nr:hypothetical protein [Dolichospermum sp. UHCC 0260]MEA5530068.1 hypothetical protein [Dolichospermum sp. UHCC 0684]